MKNTFTLLLCLLLSAGLGIQTEAKPRLFFSYATFWSPEDGPYVETYFQFDAYRLKFVPAEHGQFRATVAVLMVFSQDNQIRDFRKYELRSPAIYDTLSREFGFFDQQRIVLPGGEYDLEISISDLNRPFDTLRHIERVVLPSANDSIVFSSIQLVESYEKTDVIGPLTKSGFDIVPMVDNFFPANINQLTFYCEVYNSSSVLGENTRFLLQTYIQSFETGRILPAFVRHKRETARNVNVIFNNFDISQLPSGNYYLVVTLRDQQNNILNSGRQFFQRSNPSIPFQPVLIDQQTVEQSFVSKLNSIDSLRYFIRALEPISTYSQRSFAYSLTNTADISTLQQYFLGFWTDRAPANPQEAWNSYFIRVRQANALFKTQVKRGFETDRGRVLLQYGEPNSVSTSYHEPAAFPYEIWHYYQINGQRDKRFVFMTRDIVTNDFELIHSDVIGELLNPRWQLMLHRTTQGWDVDTETAPRHWGSQSEDFFRDPH